MKPAFYMYRLFCILALCLGLTACGEDETTSDGFWKSDENNYLEIKASRGAYIATIYRPSSWDRTLEKFDFPAAYENGVLTITTPRSTIPVVYKPEEDVIVLSGITTYTRVDADSTRAELEARLEQVALDKELCNDLQAQIESAVGTFADKSACEAFMTPLISQKPEACTLRFTSCNSF